MELKIYSGNLPDAIDCYMIVSLGHRVVCIIVSNSSVDWLDDWRGWSQSPCSCNKIFCRPNSARKLPN